MENKTLVKFKVYDIEKKKYLDNLNEIIAQKLSNIIVEIKDESNR